MNCRTIALLGFLFCCVPAFAQEPLKGVVLDPDGEPVFPANVWATADPAHATVTDIDGQFVLQYVPSDVPDSLSVFCLGFKEKRIAFSDLPDVRPLVVTLDLDTRMIEEAYVVSSPSISSDFAVQRMDKYDVYAVPGASADPLKAVSYSVHSTNVAETANPELRGSAGDYSRVVLNGVPVIKPVRNQQVNGLGNFSIFNVEMIDKEDVYAGSPPLKYGNAIGGLIEVSTKDRLEESSYSVTASLASLGVLVSQVISPRSFVQAFGNYQFSRPYLWLNENPNHVHSFGSVDAAVNWRYSGKHAFVNAYAYYVDESYSAEYSLLNYTGDSQAGKKRWFTIVNAGYRMGESSLEVNGGIDSAVSDYSLATLDENHREKNRYLSVNWFAKWLGGNLSTQAGVSYLSARHTYGGQEPESYWRMDDASRVRPLDLSASLDNLEAYAYAKLLAGPYLSFGAGLRKNIPLQDQDSYLSYQFSLKVTPARNHSVLLSLGKYYGYSSPEYYLREIVGVWSRQYSVDYNAVWNRHLTTQLSLYHKEERIPGLLTGQTKATLLGTRIRGVEASASVFCNDHLDFSAAYSFIRSEFSLGESYGPYYNDMPFMVKLGANVRTGIVNLSLNVIGKSGFLYTPLTGSRTFSSYSVPEFGEAYSRRAEDYWSCDLILNRRFALGDTASIILFATVNNLLNRHNPRYIYYDANFDAELFKVFNGRAFYFGMRLDF